MAPPGSREAAPGQSGSVQSRGKPANSSVPLLKSQGSPRAFPALLASQNSTDTLHRPLCAYMNQPSSYHLGGFCIISFLPFLTNSEAWSKQLGCGCPRSRQGLAAETHTSTFAPVRALGATGSSSAQQAAPGACPAPTVSQAQENATLHLSG